MSLKNVLIVEDNEDIARLIRIHLADMGCHAMIITDGLSAIHEIQQRHFDLIILDLMLPNLDGLEVCRRIRKQSQYTPVLILTSKSSEQDRITGLEIGADDYITKPFSIRELVARVKAQFRRDDAFSHVEQQQVLKFGELCIETENRQVTVDNKNIDLTAKEFDLLLKFSQNPGRVFSRLQLLDSVWGYGHDGYEHTVNSHINRLRSKIEQKPAQPHYILTVWGVGYKFNPNLPS
jgi:DNA-binding response OmpR family regulator